MTDWPPGLRLPAEWEPHAGTWMSWPHNPDTWHRGLDAPRRALARVIRELAAGETVYVNASDGERLCPVPDELADLGDALVWLDVPTDDAWCRDHGALIARRPDGARVALDFGFDAWGGKYPPWDTDARVGAHMAAQLGLPRIAVDTVLEGGAVDVNGQGAMLTTASCVLDRRRNARIERRGVETLFARAFGVSDVFWLGGELAGDDTDGHIDNLARFVSPWAALVVVPMRSRDAPGMAANPDALATQSRAAGLELDIATLPMPSAFMERHQLPASYANFYVANDVVLQPVYADPADDAACALVEASFPGRRLVPVDCRDLVVGLGALHCLTQQVPSGGDRALAASG